MKFNEKGLAPLIIQNSTTGQIISLVYVNQQAIEKIKETGYVWRYSRKHDRLMKKGETSKNTQKVISLIEDCDNDALVALVEPNGPGCHTGNQSCFNAPTFTSFLYTLEKIIQSRKQNLVEKSYTTKLLQNDDLLKEKLREELDEFINYKDKENLIWETADLLYFTLVYLNKHEGTLKDVEKHLELRNKK